jgi:hypothetical protein
MCRVVLGLVAALPLLAATVGGDTPGVHSAVLELQVWLPDGATVKSPGAHVSALGPGGEIVLSITRTPDGNLAIADGTGRRRLTVCAWGDRIRVAVEGLKEPTALIELPPPR